jgi:hypothetical protein
MQNVNTFVDNTICTFKTLPYHMKKIAALLATVVILTILLSACGTSDKCAAYGEYKDYRVETK